MSAPWWYEGLHVLGALMGFLWGTRKSPVLYYACIGGWRGLTSRSTTTQAPTSARFGTKFAQFRRLNQVISKAPSSSELSFCGSGP